MILERVLQVYVEFGSQAQITDSLADNSVSKIGIITVTNEGYEGPEGTVYIVAAAGVEIKTKIFSLIFIRPFNLSLEISQNNILPPP